MLPNQAVPPTPAPRYIGLCGPKRGGKDTVARLIIKHRPEFRRVAFADIMKAMALAMDPYVQLADRSPEFGRLSAVVGRFGWENAKNFPDVRRFLQRLGTEGGRECLGQDVWVHATWRQSVVPYLEANAMPAPYRFVFTDVRFANEIHSIQHPGYDTGELWRIERSSVEDGDPHPSEREWRESPADFYLANESTLDWLEGAVVERLRAIGLESQEAAHDGRSGPDAPRPDDRVQIAGPGS